MDTSDTTQQVLDQPDAEAFDQRGFALWEPVKTDYGADVKVKESSAAEGPHLWLEIKQPPPEYEGALKEARAVAHCTLEQAKEIRDRLDAAIRFSEERWGDPDPDDGFSWDDQ